MPFCDQIFYGSLRDPHIVLEKSSNFLSSGCFPLRSYYPLRIVGEGWLTSSGDKGWFFVPPNVLPGDTNVFFEEIPNELSTAPDRVANSPTIKVFFAADEEEAPSVGAAR